MNWPRTEQRLGYDRNVSSRKTSAFRVKSVLATFAVVCFTPISPSGAASFQGLGDLPGGSTYSEAWGVATDGSVVVVVGLSESASGTEAFRWTAEQGMVGLGDLPGGDFYSRARGVSGDGSIVVGESSYALYEGGDIKQAFCWTPLSEMQPMGFLPGAEWDSSAMAISSDGSTIVGQSWSAYGVEGFRSTGLVIQPDDGLGGLPNASFHSSARGASQDGAVVVGRALSGLGFEAFRWTEAAGMEPLGVLPEAIVHSSKAFGVSADGSIVVGGSQGPTDGSYEACLWENGQITGLGDLPGGRLWSLANAVSGDGSVVVGYGESESGYEAFIWDQDNGMRPLKTVLQDCGVDMSGWGLRDATAISPDGLTIVGYGGNPDGHTEAWIAVLVPCGDTTPPQIFISAPEPYGLYAVGDLVLDFSAYDLVSGWIQPPALSGTLTDAGGYSGPAQPGDEPGVGVYELVVTATDEAGNTAQSAPISFVVYDPDGGFVTGGGWIWSPAGAYVPKPEMEGRATFAFQSKYKQGATKPTGQTNFVFRTADLRFSSSSYDWLVVTGSNYTRFKGTGTINGSGEYKFMLWAEDAPDTFRIRIWEEDEAGVETDVYDNGFDQEIGGGSVVVHAH